MKSRFFRDGLRIRPTLLRLPDRETLATGMNFHARWIRRPADQTLVAVWPCEASRKDFALVKSRRRARA
jgi:hypothetical protein